MDGEVNFSIGELARRTGLTVKTIRFYSDRGIVPPTDRSTAGYAVLTAVAERGATPEEMDLMHKLAKLSEDERHHLIGDFLDSTFGGLDANPAYVGIARSMTPELPDNPQQAQLEAWVELAELTQDPDFRAAIRRVATQFASDQHSADEVHQPDSIRRDPVAMIRDEVRPALAAGIDPTSAEADAVVAAAATQYAHEVGQPDDVDLRRRLLSRLESANDPRRDRYLQLLATINGWQLPEDLAPTLTWFIHAVHARVPA